MLACSQNGIARFASTVLGAASGSTHAEVSVETKRYMSATSLDRAVASAFKAVIICVVADIRFMKLMSQHHFKKFLQQALVLAVNRVTYTFPRQAALLYVYVMNVQLQTREEYFQTLPECIFPFSAWAPSKSQLISSRVDIEVRCVLLARLAFWNMTNKSVKQTKQLSS